MAEVFLPAINPVDLSDPNNLGGFLGTGDLTSNDGDTSGWEGWDVSNIADPAYGRDMFRYDIDTSRLPRGAVIQSYRFEMTARLLPEHSTNVNRYPTPTMSGSWPVSGGHFFEYSWPFDADFFVYNTVTSNVKTAPADMIADLTDGTATLTFTVYVRDTNWTTQPQPVRVTKAGIWVYYTGGTLAPQRLAPLRVVQRGNDGLGITGGRRVVQTRTVQSSSRATGIR